MPTETLLAVLPASQPTERITLVLVHSECDSPQVVLRQESWCNSLGWCVQKTISMTPQQVGALRAALGQVPGRTAAIAGPVQRWDRESLPQTIPFPGRHPQAETA